MQQRYAKAQNLDSCKFSEFSKSLNSAIAGNLPEMVKF